MLFGVGVPRHDRHKVRHKRWDLAFQHRRIATNNIRFVDIRIVQLGHHYKDRRTRIANKIPENTNSDNLIARNMWKE